MEEKVFSTKNFFTKTERRVKENPHINGIYIIGLDMGYSGPKGFHEKGNFVFPNYCEKITGELFGELGRDDMIYEDLLTGEKYRVGEFAIKTLSEDSVVAEDTILGRNHYLHPDFLVKLRTALGIALWGYKTDGSDVFIQTGLPPEYISTDEKYLRMVIQKKHQFRLTIGNETKDFDFEINADQVDVMYQPMGTYYSVVTDQDGKITSNIVELNRSNIMVLDGGFGTLDKFVVQANQLKGKGTNPNLGMRRVIDETRKMIEKELGTQISITAMQKCLKTGQIEIEDHVLIRKESYPIDKYLKAANEIVREEAFQSISEEVFKTRYLIMTGGTCAAWYDYFKQRLSGLSSLEVIKGNFNSNLPMIYANARGYYMFRLNQLKTELKMKK